MMIKKKKEKKKDKINEINAKIKCLKASILFPKSWLLEY